MQPQNQSPSTPADYADEHDSFAASRSNDFVYVPIRETLSIQLDHHADTVEADVKPPLVITGPEGSGKSAVLANWANDRRKNKHRDEFIFTHFVSGSRNAELGNCLNRLVTQLHDFFHLREMEIPESEEKCSWALSRFLAAASKKHSPARIVIIIDGVNLLKGVQTPLGSLHWLPTSLPPCVRFIISCIDDGVSNIALKEINRRNYPMISMEIISLNCRTKIIAGYFEKFGISGVPEEATLQLAMNPASSQPLYLRCILCMTRLMAHLGVGSIPVLLDTFQELSSAAEIVDKALTNIYQTIWRLHRKAKAEGAVSDKAAAMSNPADLLMKMFSMIYTSRDGLSRTEIWGLLELVSHGHPVEEAPQRNLWVHSF